MATPAWADPALTRVTLFQGGVGQYEFTAETTGTTLTLDLPLDQVDDVLKSLRVENEPFSVRLPGHQPLSEAFRTLPFTQAALASAEALLGAAVGETVRLPVSGLNGTILAVTAFNTTLPNNGGVQTRHRLTIATATGLDTVVLEDTGAVEFTSTTLRNQIASALAAIAASRTQDRRAVQLVLADGPSRTVHFGYVTAAPVWKTSYRLTVPADATPGSARLQGYAVVENLSGQAWHGVEVVLTSGQPVLYHQALYTAVFAARPEAAVDVPGRLTPRVDQGNMPVARAMAAPAPAAPSMQDAMKAEPPPPAEAQQGVAQVSYRLTAPVDAAVGETLLLPLLDRPVPAARVALLQPETDRRHPLVALLLKNDAEAALPPGLVSLFEPSKDGVQFVGDARLPALLPGEERLATFAADLATRAEVTTDSTTEITTAHAARGVLEFQQRAQTATTYRITAPPGTGRTVLIEQRAQPGYELTEPLDGVVRTPDGYRITRPVAAGATETLRVVLSAPTQERLALGEAEPDALAEFTSNTHLDPKLRAGLQRLMDQRAELDRKQAVLKTLQDRRTTIVTDQDRLRANLTAVPAQSELQRRYLAQMLAQENELATLQTQTAAAQSAADQADTALKDALLNFKA